MCTNKKQFLFIRKQTCVKQKHKRLLVSTTDVCSSRSARRNSLNNQAYKLLVEHKNLGVAFAPHEMRYTMA